MEFPLVTCLAPYCDVSSMVTLLALNKEFSALSQFEAVWELFGQCPRFLSANGPKPRFSNKSRVTEVLEPDNNCGEFHSTGLDSSTLWKLQNLQAYGKTKRLALEVVSDDLECFSKLFLAKYAVQWDIFLSNPRLFFSYAVRTLWSVDYSILRLACSIPQQDDPFERIQRSVTLPHWCACCLWL